MGENSSCDDWEHSATDPSNLWLHQRTEEEVFQCRNFDYFLLTEGAVKLYHSEELYSCEQCDYTTTYREHFMKHYQIIRIIGCNNTATFATTVRLILKVWKDIKKLCTKVESIPVINANFHPLPRVGGEVTERVFMGRKFTLVINVSTLQHKNLV